jgi:hypothetical protein
LHGRRRGDDGKNHAENSFRRRTRRKAEDKHEDGETYTGYGTQGYPAQAGANQDAGQDHCEVNPNHGSLQ